MRLEEIQTEPTPGCPWFYIDVQFYIRHLIAKGIGIDSEQDDVVTAHFLANHGSFCLSPNPLFDELYYRSLYPEVAAAISRGSWRSGFEHFVRGGAREGTSPVWFFDGRWYLQTYHDLARAASLSSGFADPYSHYLVHGLTERRSGSWMTHAVAEITVAGASPQNFRSLVDTLNSDTAVSAWLRPLFDLSWMAAKYDLRGTALEVLQEYLAQGDKRPISPSAAFDEDFYRQTNPDVTDGIRRGDFASGYHHFLSFGMRESSVRRPFADFDPDHYRTYNDGVEQECLNEGLTSYLHFLKYRHARTLSFCRKYEYRSIEEQDGKGIFERRARLLARMPTVPRSSDRHPAVSVIIVTRNNHDLLVQCLESLPGATDAPFEVILFDNASVDEVGSIRRRYPNVKVIRTETNLGFTIPVNTAARQALGEFIVLINNDVEVAPGAIDVARQYLEQHDGVGVVGARVVRTHGMLQEAGSIIWQDGSCLGYGRDLDPCDGRVTFTNDVDFCSGCFLFMRRSLWQEMGGFDEAYAPAYYEDTDFCVRVWKSGRRVVYVPNVVVWHYEYGSSRLREDALAVMRRNQSYFASKHRDYLAGCHPFSQSGVERARLRLARKPAILFLEDYIPSPMMGMGYVRSAEIARLLGELGGHLTIVGLHTAASSAVSNRRFDSNVEVLDDVNHTNIGKFFAERAGLYDIVWLSRTHNLRFLWEWQLKAPEFFRRARIIVDTEAIASVRSHTQSLLLNQPLDLGKLIQSELSGLELASDVIAVNELDASHIRDHLKAIGARTRVTIIGHSVRPLEDLPKFEETSSIMLSGSFYNQHAPNADAVRWFDREVMPLLKGMIGNAEIKIVGYSAKKFVQASRLQGQYIVCENLDDMADAYRGTRLVLAPTRFAGGIPFKVHEAARFGVPVIMSRLLGTQLGWLGHDHIGTPADDHPDSFAKLIGKFYNKRTAWEPCQKQQVHFIKRDCRPEDFACRIEAMVASVAS